METLNLGSQPPLPRKVGHHGKSAPITDRVLATGWPQDLSSDNKVLGASVVGPGRQGGPAQMRAQHGGQARGLAPGPIPCAETVHSHRRAGEGGDPVLMRTVGSEPASGQPLGPWSWPDGINQAVSTRGQFWLQARGGSSFPASWTQVSDSEAQRWRHGL